MEKHVTNRQLFFIIFLILTSYSSISIPKVMAEKAQAGSWLPLVLGAVFFALAVAIIAKLNSCFPEDSLFEYSAKIAGKFLSYVFTVIYLLYFFIILVLLLRASTETIKADFLTKTPLWATMLTLLIICGYAASKGLTNIGRLCEYFGFFILCAAFIIHGLMYVQGDVYNIRPFFKISLVGDYLGALPMMILPYIGFEIITIVPFSRKNGRRAVWTAACAVLGVGIYYIAIVYTTFMVLGIEDTKNYYDALIVAIRRVDMEFLQVLKRIDVLFIISWMWAIFCNFSMLIFTVSEYTVKLFPKLKIRVAIIMVCILALIAALLPKNYDQISKLFSVLALYFGLVPCFIIPLLLLIVKKVRKL